MLDRLKALLKSNRVENRAGLGDGQIKLLAEDLRRLDEAGKGLSDRALRYVADGDGAAVLLDLAARPDCGKALKLRSLQPYGYIAPSKDWRRPEMLCAFGAGEAAAALRLAEVYEAASRQGQRHLQLGWLGAPVWLEIFLVEAQVPTASPGKTGELRAEVVEAMLALGGEDSSLTARGALLADPGDWQADTSRRLMTKLAGLGDSIVRYPEVLKEAMGKPAPFRVAALKVVRKAHADVEPFAELLAGQAVCPAKTVRDAAEPLVRRIAEAARPHLRERAENGSGGERDLAVRLVWKLEGEAARSFLEEREAAEKSKKVLQTLGEILGSGSGPDRPAPAEDDLPELPPLPPIETEAPLPEATRDALREICESWNADVQAFYRKEKKRGNQRIEKPSTLPSTLADEVWGELQSWAHQGSDSAIFEPPWSWGLDVFERRIRTFLERPEIGLVHFVRLMVFVGAVRPSGPRWGFRHEGVTPSLDRYARHYRRSHPPAFGLRELAAAFRALGIDDRFIGLARLHSSTYQSSFLWEDDAVWPYFAERLDLLEEALGLRPRSSEMHALFESDLRRNAFLILSALPSLPAVFHQPLWEVALGTIKAERPLAQAALESVSGFEERIVAALKSGQQAVRGEAAQWLGRLGHTAAVPVLLEVQAKEKQDVVQAALLSALEKLGTPVEDLLDRDGLAAEAARGLAKGVPRELEWFPFDLLPRVHWADTGEAVGSDVVRWFLVRGFRLKSPEPGPLLRRYSSLFVPEEREELGRYVLASWLAQDTIGEGEGSAIKEKGVLAVAAACCGAAAAAPVEQYLKRWYGLRAAQCKALLQMLSWVDHPSATQLLLSVANRFRTASIRKEAEGLAQVLAERRGWTVAELADRTVPTAGFDPDDSGEARLVLDLGDRRFTATLSDELQVVIRNPEGKVVKSLPAPRKDEDPDAAKQAKKRLSAARKELKSVVRFQRDRLYEAMCTQRGWSVPDWRTCLAGHPIVGRLCRRLVWAAFDESGTLGTTFRALEDGTLTGAGDDEVFLDDGLVVRLAHACNTPDEIGRQWLAHFADYEVEPLFIQFGREPFRLPEEKSDSSDLEDFEGHLVESFKLRSEAGKLGWVRGPSEDGGWFYNYRKQFPTLELEAVLEFTGNFLPEESRTVALQSLHFVPTVGPEAQSGYALQAAKRRLGEIPAVLLGECWNDLKQLSALGPGFDPEWVKKTEW